MEGVEALRLRGADMETIDDFGNNTLHYACMMQVLPTALTKPPNTCIRWQSWGAGHGLPSAARARRIRPWAFCMMCSRLSP